MFYDSFCFMCKLRGKTPSRVGINVGLCGSTAGSWKHNGTVPKESTLELLALELECCVSDFFEPVEYLKNKYVVTSKAKVKSNRKVDERVLSSDEEELVRLFRQVAKNRRDELLFMSEVYALAERMGYDNNKKQKA